MNSDETWRDVTGYEGLYQVSNFGRFKSCLFKNHRIIKGHINEYGYIKVSLFKERKSTYVCLHQLIAIEFLGHKRCGYKRVVNHIDFNRLNNRVDNLEIVTPRENCNQKHLPSSSKYTGVSWSNRDGGWLANINVNGKTKYLGRFKKELDASEAYQNELKKLQP